VRPGSADLCVRPLPIHPKTRAPLGREQLGSAQPVSPLGIHPSTPFARAQKQGGGGADLCVRSNGHPRQTPVPMGGESTWIGPAPVSDGHSTEDNRSNGPNNSAAGARTSVSARCPFIRRPPSGWAENKLGSAQPPSAGRPSEHTVPLGPETGRRGGPCGRCLWLGVQRGLGDGGPTCARPCAIGYNHRIGCLAIHVL